MKYQKKSRQGLPTWLGKVIPRGASFSRAPAVVVRPYSLVSCEAQSHRGKPASTATARLA